MRSRVGFEGSPKVWYWIVILSLCACGISIVSACESGRFGLASKEKYEMIQ